MSIQHEIKVGTHIFEVGCKIKYTLSYALKNEDKDKISLDANISI